MSQVEEQQIIWRVVFPSSNVGLDESFRISAAPIYGSGRRLASHSEASSDVDNVMLHSWIVSRDMLEIPAPDTPIRPVAITTLFRPRIGRNGRAFTS